ncbi:hypothetical protein BH09BAC4_BH09BAC4_13040 [soil metagenome]
MPQKISLERYILSEEENQKIFDEDIKFKLSSVSIRIKKPFAIFLGGQSESGKGSLENYLSAQLIQNGKALIINSDALREFHPNFANLQKTETIKASFLVNQDTIKWQQKLIALAIKLRCSLIFDGTLGGHPEPILETMRMLREKEYQLQVSVLAVPARLSRFGIYKRYEDQLTLKGSGRWVGLETHDRQYADIPKTLALLESNKAVDRIQIYTRPTGILPPDLFYDNLVKDGDWQHPLNAVHVLTEARNRVWTNEEQNAFTTAVQAVAEQMRQRGVSQDDIDNFHRYVECPL